MGNEEEGSTIYRPVKREKQNKREAASTILDTHSQHTTLYYTDKLI